MTEEEKKSRLRTVAARAYYGVRTPLLARYRMLTNENRVVPDFVIIGAQKAGTTSLFRYLEMHPQVVPGYKKEPFYFLWNYSLGMKFYRSFFPTISRVEAVRDIEGKALVGEASTHYVFYPQAAARIKSDLPEARLILMLRDPVERAFSHWRHRVKGGAEKRCFEEAVADEMSVSRQEALERRLNAANIDHEWCERQYLSHGFYIDQIREWSEHFSAEQMLILLSEEFFADTGRVFAEVLSFLGLAEWTPPGGYPVFNRGVHGALNAKTRVALEKYFSQANSELEAYLSRPLGWT